MKLNAKTMKKLVLLCFIMFIISLGFVACNNYFNQSARIEIDMDTIEFVQLEEPKDGDTIAIIDTSLGEIRAVLYPEYSPNAVDNFITLAESGYYDNTYVFQAEKDVYLAAGSPEKNGTLSDGYDESKELVEVELHQNLWPIRGAICSMTTTIDRSFWDFFSGKATYYCGSRFSVLNSIELDEETTELLYEYSSDERIPNLFIEKGGIPNFSQQMTIIGQTYEGFDVIEALTNVEVLEEENSSTKIPIEDIMINSVEISFYSSES